MRILQLGTVAFLVATMLVACDDGGSDARADGSTPADDAGAPIDATSPVDSHYPMDVGPIERPDPGWIAAGELVLDVTDPPVADLPPGVRFAGAIHYGAHDRQVIDALLPDSDTPTAAVLFIHGGGFVAGSRTQAYSGSASALRQVLDAGIAWIGIDYRLLDAPGVEDEGVRKSIYDARRALQFVRHHAVALNIDPERIGLTGGSAGAGTSLWLAFHDDMSDASSADAIARQSTRPQVVAVVETQGTYDVLRWAPDIYHDTYPYVTNTLLLSNGAAVELLLRFYGLPAALRSDTDALVETLESPFYVNYRIEFDMFPICTPDDPPVYVQNTGPAASPLEDGFDVLHHPLHARTLRERCADNGHEISADIPAFDLETPGDAVEFLIDRL